MEMLISLEESPIQFYNTAQGEVLARNFIETSRSLYYLDTRSDPDDECDDS